MEIQNKTHLVAIVGRPNVGKSTLFNRLTGKWQAIVEDRPGITRDRLYGTFSVYHHQFRIMDTGGLNLDPKTKIEKKMSAQAEKGIEEADLIIFVMDGRAGATPLDRSWVDKLRKIRKPKVFVVNKLDTPQLDAKAQEFFELGIHPLVLISAENQRNFAGLSDAILKALKLDPKLPETTPKDIAETQRLEAKDSAKATEERWGTPVQPERFLIPFGADIASAQLPPDEEFEGGELQPEPGEVESEDEDQAKLPAFAQKRTPNIAIIGRPNVGKSTLLNAILEEERSIVDDTPGTTRDPIHTYVTHEGQEFCFIDTAGIRKRARATERVEKFSVVGALNVIEKADIVLLVLDGEVGPTDQDAHVAGFAFEQQKGLIVVVNKWDEGAKKYSREEFKEKLELKMNYLSYCPLIFISAKTGKNLHRVFEAIAGLRAQYDIHIKTGELNKAFQKIIDHHPLPTFRSRDIKMFYATQVGARPPSFVVFCTEPDHVHFTYKRYLINALRETFGLHSVPIRLIFRKR